MIYFKILRNVDLTQFKKVMNKLKEITGKSKLFLFIDILICFMFYGAGYHDYYYYEFYNLKYKDRKTILTRVKNNKIIKEFNNKEYADVFENKSIFMETFKNYVKRDFINLDDEDKFIEFFKKHKRIVLKPLDETGGTGVELIEYTNIKDAKDAYNKALKNKQLLAEELVIQHDDLNKLYSETVNTLRVFTFYNNGEPKVVYSILKIGRGKLKDNFASGGMYVQLNNEGVVISAAIDSVDREFEEHPITKVKFRGFKVPLFDEVISLTTEAAKVIREVGYIGWDVAITKNGPLLIEGNYYPGIFQMKPSLTDDYKLATHLEKELGIKL